MVGQHVVPPGQTTAHAGGPNDIVLQMRTARWAVLANASRSRGAAVLALFAKKALPVRSRVPGGLALRRANRIIHGHVLSRLALVVRRLVHHPMSPPSEHLVH